MLNKILYIFAFLAISKIMFAQWMTIRSVANEELYGIDFVNSETGYAVGSTPFIGTISLKTTNAGSNWFYILNTTDSDRLECVEFPGTDTGYAGSFYGKVYKTTNGGMNWTTRQVIFGNKDTRILKIHFANNLTGWIGTQRGYYYTGNGGTSWIPINLNFSPYLGHDMFFFKNSTTGFICSNQYIYKTTNGGTSYTSAFYHNTNQPITSVKFINENTGWACGHARLIMKSTNGGDNWNLISMDSIQHKCHDLIFNADFGNSNVGYIVGQRFCGGIWGTTFEQLFRKTTDGGLTWNYTNFYSGLNAIEDITFVDSLKAFAVGYFGRIFRNNFAGLTDIKYNEFQVVSFSLSQNYPNPFNPVTKINYSIPTTQYTVLKVFDALGKEVVTLVNQKQNVGSYEVEFNGEDLPSGVYFYKLWVSTSSGEAADFIETKRMILLK